MSVLSTVLLILGIAMLIEGGTALFFPKVSKYGIKLFIRFMKSTEKHLKAWGIAEIILAIIILIISVKI